MNGDPRGVLWDLDGTLIDSADHHFRAWREVLSRRGFHLTRDRFQKTFGWRNDAILHDLLGRDISDQEIASISDTKEELYRQYVREDGIALLPGADQWTLRLHASGWRQAIASSAPKANIDTIVDTLHIGERFQALVSADDVPSGKPDPGLFLAASARLSLAPNRCVVVEDAPAGIEAAHRGGMRAIGVLTTQRELAADLVVDRLDRLPPDAFQSLLD